MPDSDPQMLAVLSAQIEGLEAAVEGLAADTSVGVSLRRIARSLQSAALSVGATEIAAGAGAIQKASDTQLARSVRYFLERIEEIRSAAPVDEVHILIVEDNKTVAAATQAYLEGSGRTIHLAPSAWDAETILAETDIDVVVLDLILPDRDGRDLLVHMREHARTATMPVVVLSAKGGSVARAECLAVGADDFLEKPAEPKALRKAVARLLRHSKERHDTARDGLTGLHNRVGISEEFESRKAAAAASGTSLAVAVITVDTLNEVTQALGRDAADRFLLEVCSAVHGTLDGEDALGRWERAELVAILPGKSADEAKDVLESTMRHLSESEALEDVRSVGIDVAFSGGVALADANQDLRDSISVAERLAYNTMSWDEGSELSADDPLELPLRRILLVEDDRVTATLIRHRLIRDGHEVVDFLDGHDAFEWASEEEFDLAILDVKVPGMDGFELLERLRKIERLADVPIVMLTGMGSESDVIRGLELGADDYVLKPFSPSELLARVRRLLHARSAGAGRGVGASLARRSGGRAR